MVGYSRLMGIDEEGTIARQKSYRKKVIDPGISANGGRIVNTSGDGLLAEFVSVIDAVQCAVSIQQAIAADEQDEPDDSRIRYRVGINMGDIIVDGEDILGDGVNIAARLETLAEPNGVCISDVVHRSIDGKLDVAFEDIGPQHVKNIAEPLRVWRWTSTTAQSITDDVGTRMSRGLPDKPSIAVLPFTNMSGDKEQEYFADGMAEDIITALSRMPWFFVIARNSSFTYKGRAVDVKAVGLELGVAYVLEGSVRKAGNRLRITGQLIDAATGNHVWADRYDREITDIFDIQDEITQAIIGAVAPEFLSAELKKSRHKEAAQLGAWECVMRGRALVWKFGREDAAKARRYFERAGELSPDGELGLGDLALVHFLDAFYGWSDAPQQSSKDMVSIAEKAVATDENDPLALTILAWAYNFAFKWDEALNIVDRAIALSPNFAPAIGIRGVILACADEPDLAIIAVNEAIRRSPRDGFMPFWLMGVFWAYHSLLDYEKALAVAREGVRIAPENPTYRRQVAVACAMLGRTDDCRDAVSEYLRISPSAVVEDSRKIPARNQQTLERFLQALKLAGVPEADNSLASD